MVHTQKKVRLNLILIPLVVLCGFFVSNHTWAASQAHYASGWSVFNDADWTPFPPSANPLGAEDNNCTGGSIPNSWAEFTFPAFSIPSGDSVTGVEVRVKYRSVATNTVRLTIGGSLVGTSGTVPLDFEGPSACSSTHWREAGGDGDLWGETAANLKAGANGGTLGFRFTQDGPTVAIDAVELVVFHAGANTPPNAVCQNVTVSANSSCQGSVTAAQVDNGSSDPDPGDSISLSLSPTGPFSLGSTSVTLTVTDSHGATDTCTATVTVDDNTPPVITLVGGALTLQCHVDTFADPGFSASDACDTSVPVTVGGDTVDVNTPGTYTITYNATDDSGNPAAQKTREVTVQDTIAPVITLNGGDVTLECHVDTYTEQGATASDACDASVSVMVGGDTVNVNTPGTYTITYNATDDSGNPAAQKTREVTVQDTIAPVITLNGGDVTLECHVDTYTEQGATASDACDASVSVTVGGDTVDVNTPGTYIITYDAQDGSGNHAAQKTRTVVVQDTIAPVITLVGGDLTLECHVDTFAEPGYSAADLCDTDVPVTVGGDTVDVNTLGTYIITYDAQDDSGNHAAQKTRTVVVEDTIPPEIQCNAPETIIPPDAPISFTATAMDLCAGAIIPVITGFDCFWVNPAGKLVDKTNSCEVTFAGDTITILDSGGVKDTIEWTVTADDGNGNVATETCSVTVVNPAHGAPTPQPCPPCPGPGGGFFGAQSFKDECAVCGCVDDPAITCNDEFSIALKSLVRTGALVTFTYEICKLGLSPVFEDLAHWVLGLDQIDCLKEGMTLDDLVAGCAIPAPQCGPTEWCVLSEPDLDTQLSGIKFAQTCISDGECQEFTITLDESTLATGYQITAGCAVAATKAGEQDISDASRATPGYACVQGPVCVSQPSDLSGCTPGYWKNHTDSWAPTPYRPGDMVVDVFAESAAYSKLASASLLDALRFGGGPKAVGAARTLLRAGVAAVLNAVHPDVNYPSTVDTVIEAVDLALASGDRSSMLTLASMLDAYNKLGCPLN